MELDPAETKRVTLTEAEAEQRLDVALASLLGCSRRMAQALLDEGEVRTLAGRRLRKGDRASAGTVLCVTLAHEGPALAADPEAASRLHVLHAEAALVIVDKPAGMPTHPLRPGELGTAANGMVALYPELAQVGPSREAGVVHRLDGTTSGLLCFARTQPAYDALRQAFSSGGVHKLYRAIVVGSPPQRFSCTLSIGHTSRSASRARAYEPGQEARAHGALPAETHFEVEERHGDLALVRAEARTGRMHQVRVHAAYAGFPLAGDALYQDEAARVRDHSGATRPCLHAAELELPYPTRRRFVAPLAADLLELLAGAPTPREPG